jgi:AbrB family looped-hinge helix DNA binding protein
MRVRPSYFRRPTMQTKKLVRMSSKGQIVLPKRTRERMRAQAGDYIIVEEQPDGSVNLRKQPETWLESIARELRDEVEASGFTREDLEEAIREVRRKRRAR